MPTRGRRPRRRRLLEARRPCPEGQQPISTGAVTPTGRPAKAELGSALLPWSPEGPC